jgi:hypothetical protein
MSVSFLNFVGFKADKISKTLIFVGFKADKNGKIEFLSVLNPTKMLTLRVLSAII